MVLIRFTSSEAISRTLGNRFCVLGIQTKTSHEHVTRCFVGQAYVAFDRKRGTCLGSNNNKHNLHDGCPTVRSFHSIE